MIKKVILVVWEVIKIMVKVLAAILKIIFVILKVSFIPFLIILGISGILLTEPTRRR